MAKSSAAEDGKKVRLSSSEWKYAAKRTLPEFTRTGGTDLAASLTYYTVLAIAPALVAVFSLTALLLKGYKEEVAKAIKDMIMTSGVGSGTEVGPAIDSTLDSLMSSSSGGTVALILGILIALWSASAFVKAFSRVSNDIYNVEETRGFVKLAGSMYLVTVVVVVGALVALASLLLSQGLIDSLLGPIFKAIGMTDTFTFLSGTFMPIWAWVKWPVILVLLFAIVSLLYWAAPNLKRPYRPVSPGGIFAIIGIALAVVALSIYMATAGSYSSYGAIGGVMAVLFALWVINIVLILGAVFDAEYERAKELAAGHAAEDDFPLEKRGEDTPTKADKKHEKLVDEARDLRLENMRNAPETSKGGRFPGHQVTEGSTAAEPEN
ncbi:YihY/virulence factor BrkB family protein [Helcobacillus massiliensis]|uniref:YihY/virulence factor BrkB family protein n=1 Tax=Helcobacillus massiliensis TaxID=521392 RepID=UPI0021A52034|nr:YihY/virulence factor BrkB family protein [Helcobacillus massiliensis]MCT1557443.1 YihY/virulence factor BrkB family protein [Helcobacillus massiliensis]MCT2036376.1 YihY/virulence factor BrkB family protein [Helcobacillus massiliensis]MCT2331882.1 YihY/virulence factor BrkB family protein [Helcobacillus massiliensis]